MSRWGSWALSRMEDRGLPTFAGLGFLNDVIGVVVGQTA